MKILINASNLRQGGGLQVADSICRLLNLYPQHNFIALLPNCLKNTGNEISSYQNVDVVYYDIRNYIRSFFTLKIPFLDKLVKENNVNVVLTVFGPSRWRPRVKHLCGFARAQVLPIETPYFKTISLKEKLHNAIIKHSFKFCSDCFWTENPYITNLLQKEFPNKRIFTVSNSCNQVYNTPENWVEHYLPPFNGTTILTVSNFYPHKNLTLAIPITEYLIKHYPSFNFRFVYTINQKDFPPLDENLLSHFLFIGDVSIAECPSLYRQADIMFQPSLIECFTATYPEAMKMKIPIVTSDLAFARGLCGDAALYYSALSAEEAGDLIYKLSVDSNLRQLLVKKGDNRLNSFMTAEQRIENLIKILTSL